MANSEVKAHRKQIWRSNFMAVVSITLVLLMLGLLGLVMLYAKALSGYVKENVGFTIFMKDEAKEVDILQFQKFLDASDFVKSTDYVTADEAAEMLQETLGEDFVGFMGYNPLKRSIDVKIKSDFANEDGIINIQSDLLKNPLIYEIDYPVDLIRFINKNVRKAGFIILGFVVLLSLIAISLINNNIRLAVYSKRFIINSMKLVGATQGFIRRPFIYEGVTRGILGALIANVLLAGFIYITNQNVPELFGLEDVEIVFTLFGAVLLLGLFISFLSTTFAVRKYLRLNADELYY
ncbi:MAG: cell division transport system permease protein [Bacteroidia bacterium]|jgi:cell division transport system permease protein